MHDSDPPITFDCHMHTPLCGHSEGEPDFFVDAAAHYGLSTITFTCHVPVAWNGFNQAGTRMDREQLPHYRQMIANAAEYGRQRGVEVLYGIEAEIFPEPERLADMADLLQAEPFDFVLGSLHHMLPGFQDYLERTGQQGTDSDRVAAYFDAIAAGAESGLYHSLAHPDVIRIYGTLENPFNPAEHESVIKKALDRIAATDTCLEINTSGLIKGDYIAHPDPQILKWAIERAIPFTIGSDSHTPQRVGHAFDQSLRIARDQGLREVQLFRKAQAHPIALPGSGPLAPR